MNNSGESSLITGKKRSRHPTDPLNIKTLNNTKKKVKKYFIVKNQDADDTINTSTYYKILTSNPNQIILQTLQNKPTTSYDKYKKVFIIKQITLV